MYSTHKATMSWMSAIGSTLIPLGIFSILLNAVLLVPPLYMLQVYDRVLPSNSRETLLYLTLIAVAAIALMAAIEIIRSLLSLRVAGRLDRAMGSAAFEAALSGSRASMGDIQPIRDLATVRSFIASRGLSNLFDLPFVPFFLLILFLIHPALFLLTVSGSVILIFIVILNQYTSRKANSLAAEHAALAGLTAQAFVKSADTLKAMGMNKNAVDAWGNKFAEATRSADEAAERNAFFSGLSRTLRMLLQLATLGLGAYLVLEQEITAGMIFASSLISGRALQPIDQLIGGWKQTADAQKAIERLGKSTATLTGEGRRLELPEPKGAIRVSELSWSPGERPSGFAPVIRKLSFEINAGDMVAIIGPSGAGKSTLIRLLAGVLTPSSGQISLDGADYRTWHRTQLGRCFGYLAQDVQLLPGSIAQNIGRFNPDAADSEIVAAAQRAQAHDLIMGLPGGYQTIIGGPGGSGISGGTKQRIGLARAFYGAPQILLLDEPNANLDADGDRALELALDGARASGITVILVTHRLPIASRCSKVMCLRDGIIESLGPATETLKQFRQGNAGQASTQGPTGFKSVRKMAALSSADISNMQKADHE